MMFSQERKVSPNLIESKNIEKDIKTSGGDE